MADESLLDRAKILFRDLTLDSEVSFSSRASSLDTAVNEFVQQDWRNPDGKAFEAASSALPFLSSRSFFFVFAKYLIATLENPVSLAGNEFTAQLPLLLCRNAYSDDFWVALDGQDQTKRNLILEWSTRMKQINFARGNNLFGEMLFQIDRRLSE